jgi:hypothetical protein
VTQARVQNRSCDEIGTTLTQTKRLGGRGFPGIVIFELSLKGYIRPGFAKNSFLFPHPLDVFKAPETYHVQNNSYPP